MLIAILGQILEREEFVLLFLDFEINGVDLKLVFGWRMLNLLRGENGI